ncbi:MAG: exodeoxyribonuclease V subunit beta [Deltaproteobacteria bacterium]|nr:exodeoxyribonuclease V subunit beta [Deltaproteobacteria bacterium]
MTTDPKTFDLLNSPLMGTNLIEAGAGTGKTYTVTALFLRLIIESGLTVDQILVVTFTEAATEELKQRIRDNLNSAINAFMNNGSDDPFLDGLAAKEKRPKQALRRLKEALRAFDQAAISTIHGFCRRVLHENAFESGGLFDTELVTAQDDLKREIAEDFWRLHLYTASPLFVEYGLANGLTPDKLALSLPNRIALPDLKVIPRIDPPETDPLEAEFEGTFRDVATAWPEAKDEVAHILLEHDSLNRKRYGKGNVPAWVAGMARYAASGGGDPALFNGFEKFTVGSLSESIKKGKSLPQHDFFNICERHARARDRLVHAFNAVRMRLIADFMAYAESEFQKRSAFQNIQTFDDLLLNFRRALSDVRGKVLSTAVTRQFRAALIDEFQDTDPVQYAIFKETFGSRGRPMFFIGDPKQAIYSFRGADIFAYMTAAKEVSARYTLRENWRSSADYISAVNAVFSGRENPFVFSDIPFHPAKPAPGKASPRLKLDGRIAPPLELWLMNAETLTNSTSAITADPARKIISSAVANEISRLLALAARNRAMLGDRPLREADMAVLVRTNKEARMIREALSAAGIPSVIHGTGDLFQTRETMEMERLLLAVAGPDDDRALRAALSTDIMGVTGDAMESMQDDPGAWEGWIEKFGNYRDAWVGRGFIRMFMDFASTEEVLPRLMAFPDGERRCTNLLHLSEVLQQTAVERNLGVAELMKWLAAQRRPDALRVEEHLLRLDSDEKAVRVITVHKSKGLEYPVTFCPFSWHGSRIKKGGAVLFHDDSDRLRLTLDMGSDDLPDHIRATEKEYLAENLRLLYVALTRARCRCYMVWGRIRGAETSAPAYVFHKSELKDRQAVVDDTAHWFKALTDRDVAQEVRETLAPAGTAVKVRQIPLEDGPKAPPRAEKTISLECRPFKGRIGRDWKISSFSSLVSGIHDVDELPDHDGASYRDEETGGSAAPGETPKAARSIHDFPKGARPGNFMHDIMEHLDFTVAGDDAAADLVEKKLADYGFDRDWKGAVLQMIQNVVQAPLDPADTNLTLSGIPWTDRLVELEFTFPLNRLSPGRLKQIFRDLPGRLLPTGLPTTLERLDFAPAEGFMKGFMDLVFHWQGRYYLVDWKSNHLGDGPEDYDQASMNSAMDAHGYALQYLLYSLALDLYLKRRLAGYDYKRHFGGVFYVFMRGVEPGMGPDYGIYRDRPHAELIDRFRRELVEPWKNG